MELVPIEEYCSVLLLLEIRGSELLVYESPIKKKGDFMKPRKAKKFYVKSMKDFDSTKEIDPSQPLNLDQVIRLSAKQKVKAQK